MGMITDRLSARREAHVQGSNFRVSGETREGNFVTGGSLSLRNGGGMEMRQLFLSCSALSGIRLWRAPRRTAVKVLVGEDVSGQKTMKIRGNSICGHKREGK